MKNLIITLILVSGFAMVWAVNMKKIPDDIPVEIEVLETERIELEQALKAIAEAYNKRQLGRLESFFGLNKKERGILLCTEKEDPVKSSIDLLKEHGKKLSLTDVKYVTVKNIPSLFYIIGKINDKELIRFTLTKRTTGYRLVKIAKYRQEK